MLHDIRPHGMKHMSNRLWTMCPHGFWHMSSWDYILSLCSKPCVLVQMNTCPHGTFRMSLRHSTCVLMVSNYVSLSYHWCVLMLKNISSHVFDRMSSLYKTCILNLVILISRFTKTCNYSTVLNVITLSWYVFWSRCFGRVVSDVFDFSFLPCSIVWGGIHKYTWFKSQGLIPSQQQTPPPILLFHCHTPSSDVHVLFSVKYVQSWGHMH